MPPMSCRISSSRSASVSARSELPAYARMTAYMSLPHSSRVPGGHRSVSRFEHRCHDGSRKESTLDPIARAGRYVLGGPGRFLPRGLALGGDGRRIAAFLELHHVAHEFRARVDL